jgi:hypothetical protein
MAFHAVQSFIDIVARRSLCVDDGSARNRMISGEWTVGGESSTAGGLTVGG